MIVRRMLVVGGLAAIVVVTTAGSALADDLTDYLEDARDAIYSGQRLVGTSWDGIQSVGVFDIQHHGGMASVGSGSGFATIGDGRMHLGGLDEAAVSFVLHTGPELDARYPLRTVRQRNTWVEPPASSRCSRPGLCGSGWWSTTRRRRRSRPRSLTKTENCSATPP